MAPHHRRITFDFVNSFFSFNFGPMSHFFWKTHSVQQKGKFDSVIFVIPNIGKDVAISGVISDILEVTVYETAL